MPSKILLKKCFHNYHDIFYHHIKRCETQHFLFSFIRGSLHIYICLYKKITEGVILIWYTCIYQSHCNIKFFNWIGFKTVFNQNAAFEQITHNSVEWFSYQKKKSLTHVTTEMLTHPKFLSFYGISNLWKTKVFAIIDYSYSSLQLVECR